MGQTSLSGYQAVDVGRVIRHQMPGPLLKEGVEPQPLLSKRGQIAGQGSW